MESRMEKKAVDLWREWTIFNIVTDRKQWEEDKQSKVVRLLRIHLVLVTTDLQSNQYFAKFSTSTGLVVTVSINQLQDAV